MLKNSFEENRKKHQKDWETEKDAGTRKRALEKEGMNRKIG